MNSHAELDGLIHLKNKKVGIEVKFRPPITKDQLIREYNYLLKKYSAWKVTPTAITNDYEKPEEIQRAEDTLKIEIFWTYWIRCLQLVNEMNKESVIRHDVSHDLNDLRIYLKTKVVEMQEGLKASGDWVRYVQLL